MDQNTKEKDAWIIKRIEQLTNRSFSGRPKIYHDTTNFMSIDRDHIIELEGKMFLVRCNEHEMRFGMEEQPKFWVKRVFSLENGETYILKLVIQEDFKARLGNIEVRCRRSEEKEARVLELVRGDNRYMQGHTAMDNHNNLVRIIEFIRGPHLLGYLSKINGSHENYFNTEFPGIVAKAISSFKAIQNLHENDLCHGDIRSDHILVEKDTNDFRWIDFDLEQDFLDYDLWSIGNVLHCLVGRGLVTFHHLKVENPELIAKLETDDGALFFPHRVMNLKVVYPYIPDKLNDILMRFSIGTNIFYDSVKQIIQDLQELCESLGWPIEFPSAEDNQPAT